MLQRQGSSQLLVPQRGWGCWEGGSPRRDVASLPILGYGTPGLSIGLVSFGCGLTEEMKTYILVSRLRLWVLENVRFLLYIHMSVSKCVLTVETNHYRREVC